MIVWEAPGPYLVAFTTREGGISRGPFRALNLGGRHDEPARVAENRRLACAELALDASRLAVNQQRHTAKAVITSGGKKMRVWTRAAGSRWRW